MVVPAQGGLDVINLSYNARVFHCRIWDKMAKFGL